MSESIRNNAAPNDESLKWQNMDTRSSESERALYDPRPPKLGSENSRSEPPKPKRSREEIEANMAMIDDLLSRSKKSEQVTKKKSPDEIMRDYESRGLKNLSREELDEYMDLAGDVVFDKTVKYYGDRDARRAEREETSASMKATVEGAYRNAKRADDELNTFIDGGKKPESVDTPAKKRILPKFFSRGNKK